MEYFPTIICVAGTEKTPKLIGKMFTFHQIFNDGGRIQIGALYTAVTQYMDTPCSLSKYDNLKYLRWI